MTDARPDRSDGAATPDDAATGSPDRTSGAPEGEPPVSAPARPRSRRRLVLLGAVGVVVVVAAVLVVRGGRAPAQAPASVPAGSGEGSAARPAIRAPEGPRIPDGAQLSGFVVDGLGHPVAGAEVRAEPEDQVEAATGAGTRVEPPRVPVLWGSELPPAAAVAAGIAIASPTGADGQFALAGLAPGRYRLRVSGPGLVPAEVRFVPVPSDATRIVVARQVAIEGLVTDGGKPVANVTVGLRGDPIGGTIEVKTSPTGAFAFEDLPEGRYQLFAYRGALAARAVRVSRLGAGPFAPVELRLEAASIVVGRVIDRGEGTGIAAAIELRPSGDDDHAPRYARSGDDGVFRIEGVPNGRWIADAYAPGYTSPGGVELEAGRGIPELALVPGATIEGRVLDGEGRPIAGATVRAHGGGNLELSEAVDSDRLRRFSGRTAAPAPSAGVPGADPLLVPRGELGVMIGPIPPLPPPGAKVARPAVVDPTYAALAGDPPPLPVDPARASVWTTGADGRYRIRGVGKGKIRVLAVAPGFAEGRSRQLAVDTGQVHANVDVVLTPGTFVVGRVTDQHGAPVIGAQVTARPVIGAPVDAFTDDAGEYRLGPLTGEVALSATAYGHGDATRTVELPTARGREPAEHREDLVLVVADAVLAGTLDDANGTPVAGAQLQIVGGPADGRHAIVAADGTFSIDRLPAGTLRLRIRHPDYPPHELSATATTGAERARLRLPIGGAIEGVVLEAASGAPLTGITVEATGPGGARAEAATDKLGLFKLGPLAPGRWRLAVELAGYLPLAHALDVAAGRAPGETTVRDLRLELPRGALLGGTVRDRRGQRIARATIEIRRTDGTGSIASGTTDIEGEFRVRDTPTGELDVIATAGELRGVTRVTVRPGDEILGLTIELD